MVWYSPIRRRPTTYHIGVLFDNVLAVSSLQDVLTSSRRTENVGHFLCTSGRSWSFLKTIPAGHIEGDPQREVRPLSGRIYELCEPHPHLVVFVLMSDSSDPTLFSVSDYADL